jgi:hypothetical protein
MNHRKFFHLVLYLLAFVLTLALAVPAITTAQDSGGIRPDNQNLEEGDGGWTQDGPNVYITGGKVGIGDKPEQYNDVGLQVLNPNGNAALMLKTLNDKVSSIYLREHNIDYGFTINYDGSVLNPDTGISSGLFGIWRVNGAEDGPSPVFTAYRHLDNVGIGILPSTDANTRLRVQGTIKVDDGELDDGIGLGDNNYGLIGHDRPPGEQVDSFVVRSYGLSAGQPIKLQQQIGPISYDRLTIDADGNVGIGTTSPPAGTKLAISGANGTTGLHLSLAENPEGNNSPMIKWDSTTYPGVDKIWYARVHGNIWELTSSSPSYEDVNTVIKAMPDGEVCIGSGC